MKTKNIFLFVIGLLFLSSAHSQTVLPDTAAKPTGWELGVDLLSIFGKNHVPTTSLFARYNFATKTNQYWGGRVRVGYAYDSDSEQRMSENYLYDTTTIKSIYVSIGIEYQKRIQNRYTTYCFFDVAYEHYAKRAAYRPDIGGLFFNIQHTRQNNYSAFLGLGVNYQLSKYFTIGVESVLDVKRSEGDIYYEDILWNTDFGLVKSTKERPFKPVNTEFRFRPLYTINLMYKF